MAIPPAQPRKRTVEPLLGPTWRRVEGLVPRDLLAQLDAPAGEGDDEWEEDEVEYVTLEFGQHLSEETLGENNAIQLLAPESVSPIARVGDRYFQGMHETLIGTDIFLAHDGDAHPSYQPMATSTHRITFQPVVLVPANQPAGSNAPANLIGGIPRGPGWRAGPAKAPVVLGDDGLPRKRPIGRPKGSKNKPKPPPVPAGEAGAQAEPAPAKKRGRPKGSKNKPKPAAVAEEAKTGAEGAASGGAADEEMPDVAEET
ncbi:hypothetical protein Rhopal_000496-T1 [Rhodotorula paludigena]|uniref:Transcription factor TFIIIC triple barrel domain-containing protein n=1 Tax=Rhodotorula paludigena TaxID=86838 RepID=A0AAV5GDZ0_9BASI|nr:hypothetical protein Rhopal_000496-T1 [Rhodotorula paludigena]